VDNPAKTRTNRVRVFPSRTFGCFRLGPDASEATRNMSSGRPWFYAHLAHAGTVQQEKQLKYASPVGNAVILSNASDLTGVLTSMMGGIRNRSTFQQCALLQLVGEGSWRRCVRPCARMRLRVCRRSACATRAPRTGRE
jgi:hypothetical protein